MNEISIFLVHMMDEISVNTPCDVPEKVLLLFEIAFDCIRRCKFSRLGRSGFLLLKVKIA